MSDRHGEVESSSNRRSVKATDRFLCVRHELCLAAQTRIDDVNERTKLSVGGGQHAGQRKVESGSSENERWFHKSNRTTAPDRSISISNL